MIKILLVGSGAREHAIAKKLKQGPTPCLLFVYGSSSNPGLMALAEEYQSGVMSNQNILPFAKNHLCDFCIIGPEAPLANGLADDLLGLDMPTVGPLKALAQIEASKAFTRELLEAEGMPINPEFMIFESLEGLDLWIEHLAENFVIKPDGLTGGKGVKVSGDHFKTAAEGVEIIKDLLGQGGKVIIEEKLIGQEFTLMTLTDGQGFVHLPCVQDNKRAFNGDLGPNTGGMGSVSFADFSLPFLAGQDLADARSINEQVITALKKKTGQAYRGILYGNFMAVKSGLKLIEFNCRFGDPEAMNVLAVIKSDFVEICRAIAHGRLSELAVEFEKVSTVCKYVVPEGYPGETVKGALIDDSSVDRSKVELFYSSVEQLPEGFKLLGSRALAIVAKHQNLFEAEKIVEEEIKKIKGPVFHRSDIGTRELMEKRIEQMKKVREK